jgi:8-oxo-dGTP pyrophosphatase MutT (NUDIX family)
MFTFCPSCASKNIVFEQRKIIHCNDCGFHYYHNTATAVGCVINSPTSHIGLAEYDTGPRIIFLVRGKEPAAGKLDLPGGFVEPGEGVLDGLYRELKEEIGWAPPLPSGANLAKIFTLFASFPNIYPYRGVEYNTCDIYFSLNAPGLSEKNIQLETKEIAGIRFLALDEIDLNDIAFESTKKAVQAYKIFFSSMYNFNNSAKKAEFYSQL